MRSSKLTLPAWLPFCAIFGAALYLALRWSAIPPQWIVHWGPGGVPNGWSTKSIGGVFGPLFFGLPLLVVFEVIGHFARIVRPLLRAVSIAVVGLISVLAAMLPFGIEHPERVVFAGLTAIIAAIIIGAIPVVQETKNLAKSRGLKGYESGWYYKNEDDARLWVPKLAGLGWTINFAHRWAWPMLLLTAGAPLLFAAIIISTTQH